MQRKLGFLFALAVVGLAAWIVPAGRAGDDNLKPDAEGFLRNWVVLAPIGFDGASNGAEALNKKLIDDEARLRPKAGDKIKVGAQELTWKKHSCNDHMLNINGLLGQDTDNSVAFAVTYVVADKEMKDLKLKVGSDDQAKVYLNGKEVFKFEEARAADKDQNTIENITLNEGVNVVVFKIVNEGGDWAGCLRFTDKGDQPIAGLKVKLTP